MEYKTNAPKGAALLDQASPGWASRIETAGLNMCLVHDCILGQLYGHFDTGLKELFPDLPAHTGKADCRACVRACQHGFDREHWGAGSLSYQDLQEEWLALIEERTCRDGRGA